MFNHNEGEKNHHNKGEKNKILIVNNQFSILNFLK